MKYLVLLSFLVAGMAAQAQQKQSLKDLLYSGKLKKDSSGVIRSTDDLSSKIDTSTTVTAKVDSANVTVTAPEKPVTTTTPPETVNTVVPESVNDTVLYQRDSVVEKVDTREIEMKNPETEAEAPKAAAAPRTNTRIWRDYTDSLVTALKADVLKSKKIKKETYYVTVDYEIGLDGKVNVLNVVTSPENEMLQAQVKQYMDSSTIYLNPVMDSNNQPRKVKRKQNFSITKD